MNIEPQTTLEMTVTVTRIVKDGEIFLEQKTEFAHQVATAMIGPIPPTLVDQVRDELLHGPSKTVRAAIDMLDRHKNPMAYDPEKGWRF